jgi:hypothetical protein
MCRNQNVEVAPSAILATLSHNDQKSYNNFGTVEESHSMTFAFLALGSQFDSRDEILKIIRLESRSYFYPLICLNHVTEVNHHR